MPNKLFLLDAMALIYRAYYGLIRSPRITTYGKNTNAQFGFTNTLLDIINKEKPTHIAVCFDTHAPTERHTDFEAYKANRQEAPEDLLASIPDIKKIIKAFNIPVIEMDGYEADDIIGTLAWQAADEQYEVYMVTPDKDYGQLLIHNHVFIYKPPFMGNKEEILNAKAICEKWDIARIEQVVDMLGLMGDTADNIPGIKGVGEKTAAKLLKEYDSLENVLANANNIKGSLGEKIRAGMADAVMSKKLATIITNVPVTFDAQQFLLEPFDADAIKEIFTELEFRTLAKRLLGEEISIQTATTPVEVVEGNQLNLFGSTEVVAAPKREPIIQNETVANVPADAGVVQNINTTHHQYILLQNTEAINEFVQKALNYAEICFDSETTHIDANLAELVGLSFCYKKGEAYYIPCPADRTETLTILSLLEPLFNNDTILWIGQNIKYDLLVLKWYDIEIKGNVYDTMLAHYLIEPEGRHNMDLLSAQYLNYEPIHIEELIGKKGKDQGNMRTVDIEKVADYAAEDADITYQLKHKLAPLVITNKVENVLDNIENPLVKVLTNMEKEGVSIDTHFLQDYSLQLAQEAQVFEEAVYEKAGVRFNLGSPKQLGEVLFDKLKVDPKAKKTKTGQYATGEDVLQKLGMNNPIVADILSFREVTKLKSTYVDALPGMINPKTGRVHTSYAQAVAVTGRLSSNNPNLQNIPVRTNRGKQIRKAFIPREGRVLVSADYSQIELRIVAAISGDKNMCEAFQQGKDIHTATAAKVYGIPEAEVTKEQRYKAKSVNFGIIYGQGAFGLAENLGISRTEAKTIIDNYKKEFIGITTYMTETVKFAEKNGYVATLMGRKRWLKDINSTNFTVKGYADRNAINTPIQGTAADMIKLAMIAIDKQMKAANLQSAMILQVHDELVFDAVPNELPILEPLILQAMRSAMILPNGVPVEAELGKGINWLEAH